MKHKEFDEYIQKWIELSRNGKADEAEKLYYTSI